MSSVCAESRKIELTGMNKLEIEWRSPLSAFRPLAGQVGAILLHGGELAADARWSFIAANPSCRVECIRGATLIDGEPVREDPFSALSRVHEKRRIREKTTASSPLESGWLGYAGYECCRFAEPSAKGPPSPYGAPDFLFGAYDAIAAFDRVLKRAHITGRSSDAMERLNALLGGVDRAPESLPEFDAVTSSHTRSEYCAAVSDVIARIRNGDLFQANISQRLQIRGGSIVNAYGLFELATAQSSGAFGAFMTGGRTNIVSLSPERFFKAQPDAGGGLSIIAEPIKGTRPRGETHGDDARMVAALSSDPKDRAENIMIADLTRNDLSRICDDHSIREEAICETVTHANIHHLVSRISGSLRRGVNAADALGDLFPCGSITGAPKVEAMKVIAEIEKVGRGPYCGAIGYIDDRGGADFSVAIRLAIVEENLISIPVGGGVTLRSDPAAEYEETLVKARHLLRRVGAAGGAVA